VCGVLDVNNVLDLLVKRLALTVAGVIVGAALFDGSVAYSLAATPDDCTPAAKPFKVVRKYSVKAGYVPLTTKILKRVKKKAKTKPKVDCPPPPVVITPGESDKALATLDALDFVRPAVVPSGVEPERSAVPSAGEFTPTKPPERSATYTPTYSYWPAGGNYYAWPWFDSPYYLSGPGGFRALTAAPQEPTPVVAGVPEPEALWLIGLGLVAAAGVLTVRRSRRAAIVVNAL
jgi:PEP-CTERM motif